MDFSNSTTEEGIIQEVDRICGSSDNTFTLKAKTARINQALDRFCFLAITADTNWNWDDFNQTDLPIGTTNIVSGQYDYEFADEVLVVEKVLVKDSSSYWHTLSPVHSHEDGAKQMWEYSATNTGTPVSYQKFGHSSLLDPIPNYASTNGLKVVFKRGPVRFVSTDTTTDPGIPSIFHEYLARRAALPYLVEKNLTQAAAISQLILQDEQAIKEYFGHRLKDERIRMKANVEDTR